MNMHNLSIVSMMAVAVLGSSPLLAEESTETRPYVYGMRLDIAKVLRIDEPQPLKCELIRAKMTYVNTKGVTEAISFLKLAEVCLSNG